MRSNPGPWIMLSQRRKDDNTCPKLAPVQLHGSNGGGRHIIGFNNFFNISILGFTED